MTDEENKEELQETGPEAEASAEAPAEEAPASDAEAAAEPVEAERNLPPKERRRQRRSRHSGESLPQRTDEERHAARVEARAHKAAQRTRWRANSRKRRGPRSGEGTPPAERAGTGSPRVRQGLVVSDKADKTITVRIDVARQHRVYGKIVRSSSTLHAHDEDNKANAGDTVTVVESRPLSKSKRWRLVDVLERAR